MGFLELGIIKAVIELIVEYGPAVVLFVLFVLWMLYISRAQSKRTDKLIDALLNELREGNPPAKSVPPVLVTQETTSIDRKVEHGLYSWMEEFDGDRAYLFQFHNGTILNSGIHHRLMSITHEVVRPGVEPTILFMKNLPISGFPEIITQLVDENDTSPRIISTKVPGDDINTRVLWGKTSGAEEMMLAPVRMFNNDEIMVGFIGIDFLDGMEEGITKEKLVEETAVWSAYLSNMMEQQKILG